MADLDFEYLCEDASSGPECASTCIGLEACQDCDCAVLPLEVSGPWGEFMDVLMGLLPIILLIVVTVKPNPWPTSLSLPFAALTMFLIRLMYYGLDPLLTAASVVLGLHEALTPLSIMAGAICLFETMEATYCLPYMMREMKALTQGHPIAETCLIYSFAVMIEGASGFGTPVALGAPMLVSTGHPAFESVVLLLVFNTFATVWGAVGTPIWFGFGSVDGITDDDFQTISSNAAVSMMIGSAILLPWVLTILIPWQLVRKNITFIYLATVAGTMGPLLGIAFVSYEFPSLLGGLIGCGISAVLIKFQIGLHPLTPEDKILLVARSGKSHLDIGSVCENSLVRDHERSVGQIGGGSVNNNITTTNPKQLSQMFSTLSERPDFAPSPASTSDTANAEDPYQLQNNNNHDPDKTEAFNNLSGTRQYSNKQVIITDKEQVDADEGDAAIKDTDGEDLVVDDNGVAFASGNDTAVGSVRTQQESLADVLGPPKSWSEGYLQEMLLRTFPLWGVVLLLILTRVEQIGIKDPLTDTSPYFQILFGSYGDFRLSATLVFQLRNILTYPNLNWKYEFIYLPFFLFTFISGVTFFLFRKNLKSTPRQVVSTVLGRMSNPAMALFGALVLVQLLIQEGSAAPAFILGTVLSDWFQEAFVIVAPLLGALGSFFSGSTTVSNLTFADIQSIAAESVGISVTSMLSLQTVGSSAGNGICLNNIIAACTVVGLNIGEGKILATTAKFVFSLTTLATAVHLAFYIRF